jgi:hypothetical protein
VQLLDHGDHIFLVSQGIRVGRLARQAVPTWKQRLDRVVEARVAALVRRSRADISDPALLARCRSACWEVPLVEVRWRDDEDWL